MAKGLKLKVRKFWGLIPTFGEITEENLLGGPFWPILNRVKFRTTYLGRWSEKTSEQSKNAKSYN